MANDSVGFRDFRALLNNIPKDIDHYLQMYSRNLGILCVPYEHSRILKSVRYYEEFGCPWACDNNSFADFDGPAYLRMLDFAAKNRDGCMWINVPDKVGSHTETLESFGQWKKELQDRNLPMAFVLQDGVIEQDIPWSDIAAVFIGGTTEFKLSEQARTLASRAKVLGKLVHMGRVNSAKRYKLAYEWGVDSVDGTGICRFTKIKLPFFMNTIDKLKQQGGLF
jgi:hypothetical protein